MWVYIDLTRKENSNMQIGFIGLGRMGIAMAKNLIKAGHQVQPWNRSGSPRDAIGGLSMAASPKDAFQADAVFTMLPLADTSGY
jgi:3-hydroxyisobutyrate dehydrogenase-like beta-hydroxyacid dehydrogenase